MSKILCSIATRGRYFTTLPIVLNAVINQTRAPDKIIIFDDNDEFKDMRTEMIYQYFFQMLDLKGIEWAWQPAPKKGQHHIHQIANWSNFDWVWRVDDDAVPEPNVLETLASYIEDGVGAIGGAVLTPPNIPKTDAVTGLVDNIYSEPNIQWGMINAAKPVEHLHCTFLYRANVYNYNLGLSRVAHREETLFTYGLHRNGYKILVVPNAVTWHMKNPEGGIRSETNKEMYTHDENIFRNHLRFRDSTIVILNCGKGDHIVFSKILPEIKNPFVFSCYQDIIEGQSIAEAHRLFGDLDNWDIYRKMSQWKWQGSLEDAYRKFYL
jgi:hypothetical protein